MKDPIACSLPTCQCSWLRTALATALRTEVHGGGLDNPLVADALGRCLAAALRHAGTQAPPWSTWGSTTPDLSQSSRSPPRLA